MHYFGLNYGDAYPLTLFGPVQFEAEGVMGCI